MLNSESKVNSELKFYVPAVEDRESVPVRIDSKVLLKAKAMNVPADLSMFLLKTIQTHVPCYFSCTEIMFLRYTNQIYVPCSSSCTEIMFLPKIMHVPCSRS
jgi:hypothetical protein